LMRLEFLRIIGTADNISPIAALNEFGDTVQGSVTAM